MNFLNTKASFLTLSIFFFSQQIVICLLASFYVTQPYLSKYFDESHSESQASDMYYSEDTLSADDLPINYLEWDLFNRHCHSPLLHANNRINAQLKCDQFHGAAVKWEGSVHNVEIKRVSNTFENCLSYLPDIVGKQIKCWFGEPNELLFDVYDSEELDYFKEQNRCHLNNWNVYEYRIGVKLDYSQIELYLKVHHSFTNFTRLLSRTDRVWFTGTLLTSYSNPDGGDDVPLSTFDLEKHPLWVDMNAIGCIKCKESSLKAFYISNLPKLSSRNVFNGIKYLFNVLFNPLIKIN